MDFIKSFVWQVHMPRRNVIVVILIKRYFAYEIAIKIVVFHAKYECKEPKVCKIPNKGGVYASYNNFRWTLVA